MKVAIALVLLFAANASAAAIRVQNVTRVDPPLRLHFAVVDLSDAAVSVRVVPAGQLNPTRGWETSLSLPTDVADRENFCVACNGDLFSAQRTLKIWNRETPYFAGNAANVCGWAMTDGTVWARATVVMPTLVIFTDGHATIARLDRLPEGARQAVSGSDVIESAGKNVAPSGGKSSNLYPRTAVGIDATGRQLTLLVVDGRRVESVGMSMRQLGDEMIHLGCTDALALDGGGSSAMVAREANGPAKVISWPSDGHDLPFAPSLQRPVASVLGISCTTQPSTQR